MSQASAETITVGQLGVRFLVEGADSNGSVSVFECYVAANARMPAPHSHDAFEETIYGLKGTTSWTVDGESIGIGAGEALCVPRGAVHGFQNGGGTDATFLAIASPGVFGLAYFREVGEVLAASAGGPPDVAALAEVMRAAMASRRPSRLPLDRRSKARLLLSWDERVSEQELRSGFVTWAMNHSLWASRVSYAMCMLQDRDSPRRLGLLAWTRASADGYERPFVVQSSL